MTLKLKVIMHDWYLHSTMFLLIRMRYCRGRHLHSQFTFHNVSIKTCINPHHRITTGIFTFHNVSINSTHYFIPESKLEIYIPQCFY